MKLAGFILIGLSLVVAILGAATAYLPRTSLPADQLIGLTLNSPAGAIRADGKLQPLLPKNTTLTSEHVQQLRAAGVQRVRVKEFAFQRWTGANLFIVGVAGLFAGGMMVRRATASAVMAPQASAPSAANPNELLSKIRQRMEELERDLPKAASDEDRRRLILERLGELQRVEVAFFVGSQSPLIQQLGLSGYAQLMDRFSAGERQLNRAWSAAADGVIEEAVDCISRSTPYLREAEEALGGAGVDRAQR